MNHSTLGRVPHAGGAFANTRLAFVPPNPNELVIATRASGERLCASRTKSARSGGEDAGEVFVFVFVSV